MSETVADTLLLLHSHAVVSPRQREGEQQDEPARKRLHEDEREAEETVMEELAAHAIAASQQQQQQQQPALIVNITAPTPQAAAGGTGSVVFDQERLQKMSGSEIEAFIAELRASGDELTPDQDKRLRRIRRLIKNREYAQQSRNKKKECFGGLQRELDGIAAEAKVLREQVATLSARNVELERENKRLREAMGQLQQQQQMAKEHVQSSSPPPPLPPTASAVISAPAVAPQSVGQGQHRSSVAVSACLLAICVLTFTFAVNGLSSPCTLEDDDLVDWNSYGGLIPQTISTAWTLAGQPCGLLVQSGLANSHSNRVIRVLS